MKKQIFRRSVRGSLTVEAACTVSLTLIFIGTLLMGVFWIHSRVVGNLALAETLEEINYRERPLGGIMKQGDGGIVSWHEERLRRYFFCGDFDLQAADMVIASEGRVTKNNALWGVESEMTFVKMNPEELIWAYENFFDRNESGEYTDGDQLQERDES